MKRRFALLLALTLAAPLALAQQAESPSMGPQLELTYENAGEADIVLIRNATIWTQDEGGVRENADLLIQDGKIVAVGTGLDAPDGATIIDGTGRHVTPGIIALPCQVGEVADQFFFKFHVQRLSCQDIFPGGIVALYFVVIPTMRRQGARCLRQLQQFDTR